MSLNIAECFMSMQAEGITSGVPSIFIRLQNCNFLCGFPSGNGKSSWVCDSVSVWRSGKPYTNEELEQKFIEFRQLENVLEGSGGLTEGAKVRERFKCGYNCASLFCPNIL